LEVNLIISDLITQAVINIANEIEVPENHIPPKEIILEWLDPSVIPSSGGHYILPDENYFLNVRWHMDIEYFFKFVKNPEVRKVINEFSKKLLEKQLARNLPQREPLEIQQKQVDWFIGEQCKRIFSLLTGAIRSRYMLIDDETNLPAARFRINAKPNKNQIKKMMLIAQGQYLDLDELIPKNLKLLIYEGLNPKHINKGEEYLPANSTEDDLRKYLSEYYN